jgi:hypothetical protein
MFDPASGTLVVRPEADAIIRKALRREARRVTLRLRLSQPLFEASYLLLKGHHVMLRGYRHVVRFAMQRLFNTH